MYWSQYILCDWKYIIEILYKKIILVVNFIIINLCLQMERILFTWWTFAWKTSVLEELQKIWYSVIWESSGRNIKLCQALLWDEEYRKWRPSYFEEFQRMNIHSNLEDYIKSLQIGKTKDWIIFYDRWVFDWFASLKREWFKIPDWLEIVSKNISYDLIFLFEILPDHQTREHTWRMLNREVAEKWAKFIEAEYTQRFWADKIIKVPSIVYENNPQKVINERLEFVLSEITKRK